MADENVFLFHALLLGIFITFTYDLLRIFRKVVPHRNWMVSLEDILFWIYCAGEVFLLMYRESNGTLRWFAVLGALSGMLFYLKFVSPYFVKYVSILLQKLFRAVFRMVKFLLRPGVLLLQKIRAHVGNMREERAVKRLKRKEIYRGALKKKLTFLLKAFKMSM